MKHPRLDTERGRKQQRRIIERSKERFSIITAGMAPADAIRVIDGGDNFQFISFADLADCIDVSVTKRKP